MEDPILNRCAYEKNDVREERHGFCSGTGCGRIMQTPENIQYLFIKSTENEQKPFITGQSHGDRLFRYIC
jgi:hypothetical protein